MLGLGGAFLRTRRRVRVHAASACLHRDQLPPVLRHVWRYRKPGNHTRTCPLVTMPLGYRKPNGRARACPLFTVPLGYRKPSDHTRACSLVTVPLGYRRRSGRARACPLVTVPLGYYAPELPQAWQPRPCIHSQYIYIYIYIYSIAPHGFKMAPDLNLRCGVLQAPPGALLCLGGGLRVESTVKRLQPQFI